MNVDRLGKYRYSAQQLRADFFAGLAVATVTVPQAMAYALVANVPIYAGLLAAIFGTLVASLLGSSSHLIVGPTNAVAILLNAGTAFVLHTHYHHLEGDALAAMALLIFAQIGLIAGGIQVACATFKLGRLAHFVSRSVVLGYVIGVASAVFIGQCFTLCGIPSPPVADPLVSKVGYLLSHLGDLQKTTFFVGIGSVTALVVLSRLLPRGVNTCAMVALVSGAVYYLDLSQSVTLISDLGQVVEVFPHFSLPVMSLRVLNTVLPVSFAIAVLGILEATSISKSLAVKSGEHPSVNREVFGLGVGNITSALVGGMAISGSPSRSAFNQTAGAQTRFAGVFSGFLTLIAVCVVSPFIGYIPLAALSALLMMVAATKMIDWKQCVMCFKTTGTDRIVLVTTVVSSLFFSLDKCFYIGISVSIILYLRKASSPRVVENFVPSKNIRHIDIQGELFFGASEALQRALRQVERDRKADVVVLGFEKARNLDATTCIALAQLHDTIHSSGRHVVTYGMTPETRRAFSKAGIPNSDLLNLQDEKKALRKAEELVVCKGQSVFSG